MSQPTTARARSEVAAALADRGVGGTDGVTVTVWPDVGSTDVCVVDLGVASPVAARRRGTRAVGLPTAHARPRTRSTRRSAATGRASSSPATSRHGCPLCCCRHCLRWDGCASAASCSTAGVPFTRVPAMRGRRSSARGRLSTSAPAGAMDVVELASAGRHRGMGRGAARIRGGRRQLRRRPRASWSRMWPRAAVLLAGTSAAIAAAAGVPPAPVARRINGPGARRVRERQPRGPAPARGTRRQQHDDRQGCGDRR